MSRVNDAIKATLTYTSHVAFDFKALERDLARVFANIGFDLPQSEAVPRVHATFIGEGMSLRVARDDINLVIWIEDGTGARPAALNARLAACYHTVRHIASLNELETIVWHHNSQSYTLEEFEYRITNDASTMVTPAPAPVSPSARPKPPACDAQAQFAAHPVGCNGRVAPADRRSILFDMATLDVALTHDRLDRNFEECLMSEFEADETECADKFATPGKPVRKICPRTDLAQDAPIWETENRLFREALYPDGAPKFDPVEKNVLFGPSHKSDVAKPQDVCARFATYALNGVLLVAATPIGLGMATYNVLGGENFRLTSQMLALTGMFNGLLMSGKLDALVGVI
ncbi:MAG: hypothetical protein ACWA47_09320 [Brevirhabdus sp.]